MRRLVKSVSGLTLGEIAALVIGSLAFFGTLGGAIAFYDDYRPWADRDHLQLVADRAYSLSLKDAKAWVLELELELAKCEAQGAECDPTRKAVLRKALREATIDVEEIQSEQLKIK